MLDVGCGDVFVADELGARYPRATFYAVDTAFTDELIERSRRHLRANVFPSASLDRMTPPLEGQVSLVLLMDVIEHVPDDKAFLADLAGRTFVGEQTRFLITVPAYQRLFCSHDVFLGHYRRYSPRMLREHLQASGLTVIDEGSFFFSLLAARGLQVIKERLFEADSDRATLVATWSGGAVKTGLIKHLLLLDAAVSRALKTVGVRLPGLSNYALCRKSV